MKIPSIYAMNADVCDRFTQKPTPTLLIFTRYPNQAETPYLPARHTWLGTTDMHAYPIYIYIYYLRACEA